MIKDKRGLSEVVTTIITILLVLVAIGIVWAVINNVLQSGTEQTENAAKCLQVDIKATAATCSGTGVCNVTYRRSSGGDDIDGIKIVLGNGVANFQADVLGNVPVLGTNTSTGIATGLTTPVPNSAEIAAYFIDASGNKQVCSTTSAFEF